MKKYGFTIICIIALMSFAGCGKEQSSTESLQTVASTSTSTSESSGEMVNSDLPAFSSDAYEPEEAAIIDYVLAEDVYYAPEGSTMIPAFCIFKSEKTTDGKIKVYGNFWTFVYTLSGTTLECESGGEMPGVFYLNEKDGKYTVDSFDKVGDGDDYTKDIERICDGDTALQEQYYAATDAGKDPLKTKRISYIKDYVTENHLNIDAYKDYGWDPVFLSETSESN